MWKNIGSHLSLDAGTPVHFHKAYRRQISSIILQGNSFLMFCQQGSSTHGGAFPRGQFC